MAQTERDNVTNRTNLADNTAGDISETDLRDALASAMGYASLVLSIASAPQDLTNVGTSPVLIDVYDFISAQSADVNTNGSAGVLSPTFDITFGSTGIYQLQFFASFSLSQNNRLVTFTPHINGSPGVIQVARFVATGGDTGVVAMMGNIPQTAGNKLDMRVEIDSGTATVTFLAAILSVFRVG